MKVWGVFFESGEYDDYSYDLIALFESKELAREYILKATDRKRMTRENMIVIRTTYNGTIQYYITPLEVRNHSEVSLDL